MTTTPFFRDGHHRSALFRGLRDTCASGRYACALLAGLALSACADAAEPARDDLISIERLSDITRTLASDEFEGRAPGTQGEAKTIRYLVGQFKAMAWNLPHPVARSRRWCRSCERRYRWTHR
jgi:hypothetical protein